MAGSLLSLYGTSNQTITITIASLATNGQQQSTAIDNSSSLFLDALVQLKVKTGGASTSATGYCNVYALGTTDGGTSYSDGGTGTNGSITLTNPPNARLIGAFYLTANATTYISTPFSVAAAFGGILPQKWAIVLENKTGGTLDATGGSHFCIFQGISGSYT